MSPDRYVVGVYSDYEFINALICWQVFFIGLISGRRQQPARVRDGPECVPAYEETSFLDPGEPLFLSLQLFLIFFTFFQSEFFFMNFSEPIKSHNGQAIWSEDGYLLASASGPRSSHIIN